MNSPSEKTYIHDHPIRTTIPVVGLFVVCLATLMMLGYMPSPSYAEPRTFFGLRGFARGISLWWYILVPIGFAYMMFADEVVAAE